MAFKSTAIKDKSGLCALEIICLIIRPRKSTLVLDLHVIDNRILIISRDNKVAQFQYGDSLDRGN